ncbi:hypothetical protein HYALB_00000336 [Hymenoscyphus albidus]|uniref:Uncharacterized protein n=1 Tax=Hymenoscyphus albidus TaxID=595503 RepID=A0A9N9LLG4_9HELO|nr:hypothetical protein HYALB_00000336 [Hymenoscyphus albidus]
MQVDSKERLTSYRSSTQDIQKQLGLPRIWPTGLSATKKEQNPKNDKTTTTDLCARDELLRRGGCLLFNEKLTPQDSLDTKLRSIVMFDESTMRSIAPHDDDERTDNKFVQIFIRPALLKRGDTDGEKFGVFSCIDASVVMWGELPIHHASPQQSPSNPKKPSLSPRSMSEIAASPQQSPPNPKKPSLSPRSISEIARPGSSRDQGHEDVEMHDPEPRYTSRK